MATTNLWKQFQELLPKAAQAIGTLMSVNEDGSSTIALQYGTQIRAKGGSVSAGKKALLLDGQIVKEVPDLPRFAVQV